jgi:hypothetical protein
VLRSTISNTKTFKSNFREQAKPFMYSDFSSGIPADMQGGPPKHIGLSL